MLTVPKAVDRLFTDCATALAALGIPTTRDMSTLRHIPILENLDLSGGFLQALRQIVGRDKAATVYFNDLRNQWVFPRPEESPKTVMDVSSINLQPHDVNLSGAGRYTAIELRSPADDGQRTDIHVTPVQQDWFPAAETAWTEELGNQVGTDFFPVYRRFSASGIHPKPAESRGWLHVEKSVIIGYDFVEIPGGQVVGGDEQGIPIVADFVPVPITELHSMTVDCRIQYDIAGLKFIANQPIVFGGNPAAPGDAVYSVGSNQFGQATAVGGGPQPIGVTDQIRGAYLTKVSSAATQTFRYPAEGYTGEAFTQYGITNVLIEEVAAGEATEENARERLRRYSDIVVSGSLPIDGGILRNFVELDQRVRLTHATNVPALNSRDAHVNSFQYVFGKRGQNVVEFTTDLGGVITS